MRELLRILVMQKMGMLIYSSNFFKVYDTYARIGITRKKHTLEELKMKEITTIELAKKLKDGEKLSVIDVREDDEVAQGIIPGARYIPLGQLPDRLGKIDKDHQHFMVCRSGGRSGKACAFLSEQGYDVINVTGGMLAWEAEVKERVK